MKLSIVIVLFDMPSQALNTLYSLGCDYQRNVQAEDFEVIVVENRSANTLPESQVRELPPNFRYFLRDEAGISPAAAVNFGLQQCSGEMLGLFIDGARMITPGVLELVMAARRMYDDPMVCVPAYHLGGEKMRAIADPVRRLASERVLLENMQWKERGYRLFTDASWSEGNKNGYFQPMMEVNALFVRRERMLEIGGAEEAFDLAGGGSINLHIYRRLAMMPKHIPIVLPGEGNFHQFHQGVTTSSSADRNEKIASFREQLNELWGGHWKAVTREHVLLGSIGAEAQDMLEASCLRGIHRFNRFAKDCGSDPWPDQTQLGLYHAEF